MSSLFITVLNMSLTASYAALIVMAVRFVLKKVQFPKIFSYALWAVVLFRLVCPFSFESTLSLIPGKTDGIPHDIIYLRNPAVRTGIAIVDNTVNHSVKTFLPPVDPAASVNPMGIIMEVAAAIWLFGIALLLCYGAVSFFRLKYRLSTSILVKDNIFETDRIQTPFVMGFVKPKIYIPTGLSEKELDYILKHELTHIKRYDHIIRPVVFLATVIHWFNPLMWFSYFLMITDMEMSCDESVMKQSSEDIRANYSNSLLSLSVKQSGLLSPLAFGESNVKSRIKNILNYKKPAFWVIVVAVVVVIVISAGLLANPKEKDESLIMAERFLKYKTEYVGDAPKVGNIISLLSYPEKVNYDYFKLYTDSIPYAVTVYLKTDAETGNYYTDTSHQAPFMKNAVIMFSLIDNVDHINFNITDGKNDYNMQYTRDWADNIIGKDVREFSRRKDEFAQLLRMIEGFHTDEAVVSIVESFGSKLQTVSLQAPKEILAKSMQENYGEIVSQVLIEEWINDPLKAPGRLTSSPWPDRIEILSIERLSKDEYEVKGDIIEITSVEKVNGGAAAKRPITIVVKKIDERWLIDAVTMGEYEDSSGQIDDLDQITGFAWEIVNSDIAHYELNPEVNIIDSKITRLELVESFDDLADTPIDVYALEYRLLPEDLSKVIMAGGMQADEEGWLKETCSMGSPLLVISHNDGKLELLGTLWTGGVVEDGGLEPSIRALLERN